jgi:putative Mg2+ transporter-C (MgtC) family protein
VVQVRVDRAAPPPGEDGEPPRNVEAGTALVYVDVEGSGSVAELVAELSEFEELLSVSSLRGDDDGGD